MSNGEVTLEAASVAAPIRDASEQVVVALSIVVPSETVSVPMLAPLVRATARGISRSLGAARVVS